MEIIYIILTGTLISGLFCFSFFLGFVLGMKQNKPAEKERTVELNEENIGAYMNLQEWMNYTGLSGGIK